MHWYNIMILMKMTFEQQSKKEKITAIGLQRRTLSIRIFKSLKVILITNMQIQKKRKPQFRIPKVFGLKRNTRECIRIIVWHVHY